MQVTKIMTFDAAHRLQRHQGACSNLHGHTYKVEVTVEGMTVGQTGMVIDFAQLSTLMKLIIKDGYQDMPPLDHACILEDSDPLLNSLPSELRIVRVAEAPTAELIATLIAKSLDRLFSEEGIINCRVRRVRVWETPTSFATWDVYDS